MRSFPTHLDQRDRADAIKRRASVVAVAERHGAEVWPDGNGGHHTACPHCRTGRIHIAGGAATYRCRSCGASGDVITYERTVTGAAFSAACKALELAFPGAPRAQDGPDLFGGG